MFYFEIYFLLNLSVPGPMTPPWVEGGKQCFGVYPSVDSPGLLCSCSWTTRLFTYFIFSFQAAICWTQETLTSSSGSAAQEGMSGLSFGLASCSPIFSEFNALVASCQFLSDLSTSYPTFIPTSSCVSTSPSIKIAIPTTCWQWEFGQIILPSVYSAAKCRDCPELVVAAQEVAMNWCVLTKFTCWSSSPQCVCIYRLEAP